MISAAQPLKVRDAELATFEAAYAPVHAAGKSRLASAMVEALRESRLFLCAVFGQLLTSAIICDLAGRPLLAGPVDAYETFLWAAVVFGAMALVGEVFRRRLAEEASLQTRAAYARALSGLRRDLITPEYVATVGITLAAAPLCVSAFSAAKQAIPALHPFTWDAYLSALGSRLDGGRPMWQRLQPILGRPEITPSLDLFYHRGWTALMMAVFVWVAFLRKSPLRRRYLLAFVLLLTIAGNLAALALASAGPAYFDFVVPSPHDPYSGLLAYLRSVDAHTPLLAVRGEGALWFAYRHHIETLGMGVSAMPSMHVASAVLAALVGFSFSRRLGFALTLAALATFAASVSLGWHYSLDGYVGGLAAAAIWWFAGRLTADGMTREESS